EQRQIKRSHLCRRAVLTKTGAACNRALSSLYVPLRLSPAFRTAVGDLIDVRRVDKRQDCLVSHPHVAPWTYRGYGRDVIASVPYFLDRHWSSPREGSPDRIMGVRFRALYPCPSL